MKFNALHFSVLMKYIPSTRKIGLFLLLFICSGIIESSAFAHSKHNDILANRHATDFALPNHFSVANIIIKGKVTDEKKEPLPGVTVKLRGTTLATSTDIDGNFKLSIPSSGGTLDFNFLGYRPASVPVNATSKDISVQLTPLSKDLTEVVVVALGTQKKINVTGAIATISAEDLVASSVSNISNALVGNAPGLTGLQTGGEPGKNQSTLYIRGQDTYTGNTNPLVVIDGVEQPTEQGLTQLNAMDANEIASVSILKDAASTAVYGMRAANGAIIVTTKRGTVGKPSIGFSTNFGFTTPTLLMHTTDSYTYALFRNQAINILSNDFNNTSLNNLLFTQTDLWKFQNDRDYTPAEVAAMNLTDDQKASLNASPALYYGSRDSYGEIFNHTGPQQQYNFNVRGGTEKVKYFTSLGYFNQGSILGNGSFGGANVGSTYGRYNFRSNFDVQTDKNTTISVNLAGQFGTTSGGGIATASTSATSSDAARYKILIQNLLEGDPFVTPAVIDGHLVSGISGVSGSADNPLGIKGTGGVGVANPLTQWIQSGTGTAYNTLLSTTARIVHKMDYLVKGLSLHGQANYDDNFTKFVTIVPSIPSYTVRRDASNPNNLLFYGGAVNPTAFTSYTGGNNTVTSHSLSYEAGIDYSRSFGSHSVTFLLVGKASQYSIPGDVFNTPSGYEGLSSRVTYNYKDRYNLEVDLGYNGSANFAEGKRFGAFPTYSAGWVASNEPFFPKTEWFNFLKFRGSYGKTGYDAIGGRRYLYLPNTYSINPGNSGYWLGSTNGSVINPYYTGAAEGALGNPDVTWEQQTQINAAVEARFFHDRLTFTLDLYKKNRNNILTTLGTIPASFGVSSGNIPPVNIGETTNHGYEVSLAWNDKIRKDFTYGITSSISYNRNKVIFRSEAPNPYSWQNQTGNPIGQYFGLVSDGFFNTPQELANRPYNTLTNNVATLGDIRYKDINGDGKIDNKDYVPIGYSNVPQYSFNTRLTVRYKAFDMSVLFIGTANGSMYVQANLADIFYKNFGNAFQWMYDGAWTPQKVADGTPITYPRPELNTTGSNSNFLQSDFWLKSSNFVKLKNIELGYTIPGSILRKFQIASLRFYVNGNNLYTFKNQLTNFGLDPELTDTNQPYIFPITRVLNFGASIRF